MKIITAPEIYKPQRGDITCFLAGGIVNCATWQQEVIDWLKKAQKDGAYLDRLVLFNPRRQDFPIGDPNAAEEQVRWEFKNLERMDIFSMYFCAGESDQPICMYELGRNLLAMRLQYMGSYLNRIIISVQDGYKRQQDVNIQSYLALDKDIVVNRATPKTHAARILSAYTYLVYQLGY